MALTNFPNGITSFGVPVLGTIGGLPLTGTYFFVNPAGGSDAYDGLSPETPFQTIYAAYAAATAGNNDVIVLIGNGSTSGTARMSTALAQSVTSSATTGTITWAKNATHLIGVTAPTGVSNRARFAPPTGTYTASTFGNNGNMFNVTASGCIFANFSVFAGFSTGSASQVAWIDNGGRNYYESVQFGGMEDTASAQGANARALRVTGAGENTFVNCTIGQDTVTRTVANANLDLAGATPRNKFINCDFPMMTSSATSLFIIGTGAGSIDRYTKFQSCLFHNAVDSTSTQISVAASLNAAAGGSLVFNGCTVVGSTKWGDAGALANSFVDNAPPTAATSGIAVNPS
jgi:hypothetical protein